MASPLSVLVTAEVSEGTLSPVTFELLGSARDLAGKLGGGVGCALLGSGIADAAKQLIAHGADQVVMADDPRLKDYLSDTYTTVMEAVVRQTDPQIVLLGHTSQGRDLGPRLSFRLGAGLATDCVELDIDGTSKQLLSTRPVYGGNARAIFTTDTRPQIATVRSKAMTPLPADPSRQGETVALNPMPDISGKMTLSDRVKEEVKGVKLEDAPVVVSGGRGLGGSEAFQQLDDLARAMKGAVGATRAACDNGWWPNSSQVGLTGKIVAPDLYIAVALSGASQHMAGCSGSKAIVAINKDPEANIFKEAQYGVVGDFRQVLPAFAKRLKELVEK
jgi:electron transfer flavoprotein alpha subunit